MLSHQLVPPSPPAFRHATLPYATHTCGAKSLILNPLFCDVICECTLNECRPTQHWMYYYRIVVFFCTSLLSKEVIWWWLWWVIWCFGNIAEVNSSGHKLSQQSILVGTLIKKDAISTQWGHILCWPYYARPHLYFWDGQIYCGWVKISNPWPSLKIEIMFLNIYIFVLHCFKFYNIYNF